MNNETRYNFVMFGLVKADFKRFGDLVVMQISNNLLADGINDMIMVAQYEMNGNIIETADPEIDQVNRMLNRFVFLDLIREQTMSDGIFDIVFNSLEPFRGLLRVSIIF